MSYKYPDKFIRDNVVAPFVPTSIVKCCHAAAVVIINIYLVECRR